MNALLGFAVGDAYGVPYEFLTREQISHLTLGDMVGCESDAPLSYWGSRIPAGAWSDDTSMIVASMDSVVRKGHFDSDDIMKSFINWWYHGQYTSLSYPFGLGGTVAHALDHYQSGYAADQCGMDSFYDNGNGSLMRILPYSLYCIFNDFDFKKTCEVISKGSSLTHAHEISQMCCVIYTELLRRIINGYDIHQALVEAMKCPYNQYFSIETNQHLMTACENINGLTMDELADENGYVVETLKGVIYSLLHSHNYEEAIKIAVTIGYDTDTVAGITGAVAGVIYGASSIPEQWLNTLKRKEYLEKLADDFVKVIA